MLLSLRSKTFATLAIYSFTPKRFSASRVIRNILHISSCILVSLIIVLLHIYVNKETGAKN